MTLTNEILTKKNENEVFSFIKKNVWQFQTSCGWDIGRFVDWYWGYNNHKLEKNKNWYSENSRLFRDNGQLTAVLISEDGGDDFCILSKDEDPVLLKQILVWINTNWVPKKMGLSFELNDSAVWLKSVLKEAGYLEEKNTGHEWEYDLAKVPKTANLYEGFSIESLKPGDLETIRGIAQVCKEAFELELSIEGLVQVHKGLQNNPIYMQELDIVARSPEGRIAAYCRGTINIENGICGIDPVCCHSDFRRKGLSKAIIRECFNRQYKMGGKFCYIGSMPIPAPSTFLYKALEPSNIINDSCFCLNIKDDTKADNKE